MDFNSWYSTIDFFSLGRTGIISSHSSNSPNQKSSIKNGEWSSNTTTKNYSKNASIAASLAAAASINPTKRSHSRFVFAFLEVEMKVFLG